jgi:hypothetical protein
MGNADVGKKLRESKRWVSGKEREYERREEMERQE